MTKQHPLATSSWDHKELDAIQDVIKNNKFSMGPKVKEFEENFAQFFKSNYAIMCNSGSSANLLMIAALFYTSDPKKRLNAGDEVIVPAVSWSTTYYPLQQYGLNLKFVDIDLETLNFNINDLRQAVTDKTRMIFAVNLLGNPNDYKAINEIINGTDIVLIEDNCESMGAKFNGKHTGTFGVMGSFSAFFSHHISTMEGGIVTTDDEELYQIMLSLRAHGWTRDLPEINLLTGRKDPDPFNESFKFILPGYNLRPLEMSGAVGIEQLKKLPSIINGRRKNASLFCDLMYNNDKFIIQRELGESSWFGFSLVIKPSYKRPRKDIIAKLLEKGFEVRPIVAGNFVKNEAIKYFDHSIHGNLENADYIDKNGLFIGNHHYPIDETLHALSSI
ncbi:DegT/DnrJ/EryC1/StrS family aminotransferase [Hellea sp.]|nr:DegT/DnrJ/EryC1/StrS family aminotransferase [Hellea sp.]MDA9048111.1 DegT/DnrJ/EryC1/StrS family aminotransferase [Hellea sp.]